MKHNREFDVVIAGSSLSARIAAALLAKNGYRTLLLANTAQEVPGWAFSSVFIENLLGTLGGRSCFTNPSPFQVISPGSRITLHSENPVDAELKREFGPASAAPVCKFLAELQEKGQKFYHLLWLNQGLPWPGAKARLRLRLLGLKHKTPTRELEASLQDWIDDFDPLPREFLKSLFAGLALNQGGNISVGEAALLWAQAIRPENLSVPEFETLLQKRFEQFHGHSEALQDLEKLDFKHNSFVGGHLRSKGRFTAKYLLVGHLQDIRHFFPPSGPSLPPPPHLFHYRTADLRGRLSSLLADQVVIGGTFPLRITVCKDQKAAIAAIQCTARLSNTHLQEILEPALPFADLGITSLAGADELPAGETVDRGSSAALFSSALQLGRNIFCADSSLLCPGMGPAGGALLAWTLANRLGAGSRKDRPLSGRAN